MYRRTLVLIAVPLLLLGAEWQSLDGPNAGNVDDVSIGWHEGSQAWHIYAADHEHKLYRSSNEGEFWDSIYTHDDVVYPTCVITDEDNAQIVHIGRNYATPVWKSEDGGVSWIDKSFGITNTKPHCFAMDPGNSNTIFLGCDVDGIEPILFKTTNAGADWSPVQSLTGITRVYDIAIFSGAQRMLVSTDQGLYLSTDGGGSWNRTLSGNSKSVEISKSDPNHVYASVWDDIFEYDKIHRSTNSGDDWISVSSPLQAHIYEVAIDPSTPARLYIGTDTLHVGERIYWSPNYGNNWYPRDNGILADRISVIKTNPADGAEMYAGGEFSIYKSTNQGVLWQECIKGFKIPIGYALSSKMPHLYTLARVRSGVRPGN